MEQSNIVNENSIHTEVEILQDKIEEKKITYQVWDIIFAYIMLVLGYCFIHFVLWNVTGVFTTLFFWITTLGCIFYLKKNNYRQSKSNLLQIGVIMLFAIVFSITANDFIKFLNVIFLLLFGIYWVYSVCKENSRIGRFFFFDMVKSIIIMPFAGFAQAPKAIAYSSNKSKYSYNAKLILIGLIVTIPLTVIVGGLLTSADRGIERMFSVLFSNIHENVITTVVKFFMGLPVAFYMFGMLYSNSKKEKQDVLTPEQCEENINKIKTTPNIIMYSAVTPICILYVMFFVSQLQYFISAFAGQLPDGYSVSEYARRGFFELCAIAIINLIVHVVINSFSKHSGEIKPIILKIYSAMISVFTVFIIATALSKMILYINQYGLTRLRVYTSWFMILLFLIFIYMIIKQVYTHFNISKYLFVTFVVFFGFLSFSNVDGLIARYNIEMYQAGNLEELDVEALCYLSDDGLIYVLEQDIDTKGYLDYALDQYTYSPYRLYNLSSYRVKHLLENQNVE